MYILYLLLFFLLFFFWTISTPLFSNNNYYFVPALAIIFFICFFSSQIYICDTHCFNPIARDADSISRQLEPYLGFFNSSYLIYIGYFLLIIQCYALRNLEYSSQSIYGFISLALPTLTLNQLRESLAFTFFLLSYNSNTVNKYLLPPIIHPALLASYIFDIKKSFNKYNFVVLFLLVAFIIFFILNINSIKIFVFESKISVAYFGAFFEGKYYKYSNFKVGILPMMLIFFSAIYIRKWIFSIIVLFLYFFKFYLNNFFPDAIIERYLEIIIIFVWLNISKDLKYSFFLTFLINTILLYRVFFHFMNPKMFPNILPFLL